MSRFLVAQIVVGVMVFGIVPFIVAVPETARAWFRNAVEESCHDARISLTTLATMLGLSVQQLNQWMATESNQQQGQPTLLRWYLLIGDPAGERFLDAFMPRYLAFLNRPQYGEALHWRASFLGVMDKVQTELGRQQLRMAKCALRSERKEVSA